MRALRTAAFVVGAAALVATGVGAAVSAGLIGSVAAGATSATFLGVTAATFTAAGAIAGAVGAGLSLAAAAVAPKGSVGGSATQFKIDKDAGMPVAIGRTHSGGNVAHRQFYGSKNSLESWVTIHSIGPVRSLGPLLINKAAVALNGTAVGGGYAGYMWLDQQLGACPEARAMAGPSGNFAGWGSTYKLSGLAADLWTLKFDDKGKVYPNGVPQRGRIVEGVYVYDPRQDSTYPGGSGGCRLGQEATYVWSENPALHAITWAFGRYQNGTLIAGGGLSAAGIDMPPFVDWANVCDANGWKVGGIVYTSTDNSWDILKMIAQAGGGEVMAVGAQLSCTFSAPRVSIGTITSADIIGDIDVPVSASRRLRRNTVIPRVRLESHGWEVVPLDAIAIPQYVTVDGGSRPKEIDFPLVQQVDQGAQLGLYEILNARELDGIVLPAKVYAIGYRPGDCLTVDIPEASLVARDVIVRGREIDGASMGVTLTCRSETQSKHPFCLGKTGVAPPTPDLSVPVFFDNRGSYRLLSQSINFPFTSDDDSIIAAAFSGVLDNGATLDFPAASINGLASGTSFAVMWRFSTGSYVAAPAPATAEFASSDYVFLGAMSTSSAGDYPADPTPPPGYGGGGGYCVTADSEIQMADGTWKRAGDVHRGDQVLTQHEQSMMLGLYTVVRAVTVNEEVMSADGYPDATPGHLFWEDRRGWFRMDTIGTPRGRDNVVQITVAGAHTYVARKPGGEAVLSHNIKPTMPQE